MDRSKLHLERGMVTVLATVVVADQVVETRFDLAQGEYADLQVAMLTGETFQGKYSTVRTAPLLLARVLEIERV